MPRLDPFTQKRLLRFIEDFRARSGQLPTLQDLAVAGFEKSLVNQAVRDEVLVELYVNLTSGTMVKGYKAKD